MTSGDASANNAAGVTWARPIDQTQLQSLHASAPGLQRATNLASVHHGHLQQVFAPEVENGRLLLRVAPIRGELLADKFASDRPSLEESISMIRQIAEALSELHRQGLAHGRVLPDRVYVTTDGPILAVDPLCAVTTPVSDTLSGVLRSQLGELRSAQFLAPEYLAPGSRSDHGGRCLCFGMFVVVVALWISTCCRELRGSDLGDAGRRTARVTERLSATGAAGTMPEALFGPKFGRQVCHGGRIVCCL